MTEVARHPAHRRDIGGIVDAVRQGSIAQRLGMMAGDRIVAINGRPLRDAVDYQFMAADDTLELEALRGEAPLRFVVEKHPDEDLGVEFRDAAFDGIRPCNNSCFFCFLKGNPKGMRKTLYVKDDDYRLSFFHGNFVTLTNLNEDDWARIEEQRLSPLNVSVHATDPGVRRYLLGNRHAPEIIPQLRRLAALGIEMHTQVVLCPGVNDGEVLDQTIADLAALYPAVRTISIVPVGETEFAEERIARGAHGSETRACTPPYARSVIARIAPCQARFRAALGATVVHLADELYLTAGAALPPARFYDGFTQYENGIGMMRSLLEDWRRVRRRLAHTRLNVRRVTFVTGTLAAPTLARIADDLATRAGIAVSMIAVENRFFGPRVNVAGLLVSRDIAEALRGRDLGDVCILPRYALDYTGERFLDDRTPGELQRELAVPLGFASTTSDVLRILAEPLESQKPAPAAATNGKAWVDWDLAETLGGRGLAKEVRR